ncbi:LacI family DNA-binding transcriptional regulator [Phytohabitans sp. LJ34]|uniref:LacI family DNA-binding transcriptional regulator n=1 Tax=Phytohabitans sp. LJ34 TaxID=3452217 RepID=UPI003F894EE5
MTVPARTTRTAVIGDVARLAGVSNQTVSRVLNDHPRVHPETRDRVLEAVRQLNYRPNAMARGLVRRRSHMIGVVSFDTVLFGPAATLLGIGRAARAAGYGVNIITPETADRAGVIEAVETLASQAVAGVIIVFAPQAAAATALYNLPSNLPVVAIEVGVNDEIPTVRIDQSTGARLAVEHLLELGHQTVWHVAGPRDRLDAQDRVEGWRATLEAAGRTVPPVIVGDWSAEAGFQAGLQLARRDDVTAIFAANDQMALGLLRGLHESGVRVPDDISVVGFDDIPEAGYLIPPLTTIRPDHDHVGRQSVTALLHLLDHRTGTGQIPAKIVPTLIRRRSTAPPYVAS